MTSTSLDRRTFIAGSSAVIATFLLSCEKKDGDADSGNQSTLDEPGAKQQPLKPTTFEVFAPEEVVTLGAILERLLPGVDEIGAPSAVELDVMYYIDGQLRLDHFSSLRDMMTRGMKFVEVAAKKYHQGSFHTRQPAAQDQILADFQNGAVKGLRFPQERFFNQLKAFALEGYWGSPKYGGNKDRQAWAWVEINPHCSHIYDRCVE